MRNPNWCEALSCELDVEGPIQAQNQVSVFPAILTFLCW